jgi:hypothetical protein
MLDYESTGAGAPVLLVMGAGHVARRARPGRAAARHRLRPLSRALPGAWADTPFGCGGSAAPPPSPARTLYTSLRRRPSRMHTYAQNAGGSSPGGPRVNTCVCASIHRTAVVNTCQYSQELYTRISRGLAGARLEAPPQPRVLRQQSVEDKPARTPVPSPTLRVRASRRHYLRRDRRQRPPRHPHRGRGAKRDPANLMSSCRPHHTAIHRPMGYRRVETATAPPVRTPGCPTHTHPAQPGYPPAPHIYNSRTLADRTQTHPLPPAAMPNAGQ